MKNSIKLFKSVLILLISLVSMQAHTQSHVIEISGDAYVMYTDADQKEQYDKLSYGPLRAAGKLILKEGALVTVIDDENNVCKLKAGDHTIGTLPFSSKEADSGFTKFCNYFKSFFLSHNSTESKKAYKNNIYAISRGEKQAPALDFPVEGDLSLDPNFIPFKWTHDCESCEYIFTINRLDSKEIIFTEMTSANEITLDNPGKYLESDAGYYWSIKTVGQEMEYENAIFSTSTNGEFTSTVKKLKADYLKQGLETNTTAEMIYMLSYLESVESYNDAVLLGLSYQSDQGSVDPFVENFIYDIVAANQ